MKTRWRLGVSDTPGEVERADHLDAALDARLAVAAAERVADDQADELVRLDACALDERHGDVVGAAFTCTGTSANRFITSAPGAPRRSTVRRSSLPPTGLEHRGRPRAGSACGASPGRASRRRRRCPES